MTTGRREDMEPVLTNYIREPHSYTLDFSLKHQAYDGLKKALAMKPKILFLDEVNAGLNTAEIEQAMRLIHQLAQQGLTIVVIEHLMKVVLDTCSRVVVLQNGKLIADGDPHQVVRDPVVIEAYLGQKYARLAQSMSQGEGV